MTTHIEELNPGLKDLGTYEFGWADSDAAGDDRAPWAQRGRRARHLGPQERARVDARSCA